IKYIDSEANYGAQIWYGTAIPGLRIGYGAVFYDDMGFATVGQVPLDDPNPFLAGQSYRMSSSDVDIHMTVASVEYIVGDWNFAGEYLNTDAIVTIAATVGPFPMPEEPVGTKGEACYVSGARRFGDLEAAITYPESYDDVS